MDNVIPSENPSGVEQLKRSVVIAAQNVARLRSQLENEPDEFTRSRLLKLLLLEAERSRLTNQQLDRIDCHMAELIAKLSWCGSSNAPQAMPLTPLSRSLSRGTARYPRSDNRAARSLVTSFRGHLRTLEIVDFG